MPVIPTPSLPGLNHAGGQPKDVPHRITTPPLRRCEQVPRSRPDSLHG